ncbi:aminopeptidase P family N-terminal domain-containing protein, partial [Candidatus Aenigmatarchaeota archaeon]
MGPDLSGRLKRLRDIVKENGLDAVIISSPRDIEYYTGIKLTGD